MVVAQATSDGNLDQGRNREDEKKRVAGNIIVDVRWQTLTDEGLDTRRRES